MCSSYSVIPERWTTEFLSQCHEIWCPDFTFMSRCHLFYTINQNIVRHIWQLKTDNLLLYIKAIISTKRIICTMLRILLPKCLQKPPCFPLNFAVSLKSYPKLLGKQAWLCNPRHSLLAKKYSKQQLSWKKRMFCCYMSLGPATTQVLLQVYDKKGLQNHSRQKRHGWVWNTIPWNRKTVPDKSSCESFTLKKSPSKLANIPVHGFS